MQSPSGALTQIRMSSFGSEDVSPVRTLRTVPSDLRVVQEKQMPMRQPNSGVRPALSAWASNGSPVFVLANLLMLGALRVNSVLGVQLFEYTGETSPDAVGGVWNQFVDRLQHLVLPTFTLALAYAAWYSRYQRFAMLDVLGTEHIRMARANGVPAWSIVWVYSMKNVAIRVVTITGLLTIGLLGGDVIVENVFGLPGLGAALTSAVLAHDVPVVLGITMMFTIIIVLINLATDLVYWLFDPRVRTR